MSFPPRFLDELRARVSLAEMVARRVRLIRRGREFVALCPFHNEKTPSFYVVEEKGFFHCFGCGAHGDAIGFLMQTANLGFREAVEQLAQEAGLDIPKQTPEEREKAERQATIQDAVAMAAAFFEEMLQGPQGREARLYLERRGLDAPTVRRFHLGYAPERRDALKQALRKHFPEPLLLEAGLLRRPETGDSYDYFRNRVMFPIGDRQGRVIAFGGRVLGDGEPKYLNSPETPLFQKGRVLYGWAAARAAAAREPSAIVTEGYMDVIALQRAGFATAVAPLGTALTEHQLEELWRLAPEPVLCFDGDAAGLRAAGRALERALPLVAPGRSLKFATLPEGEDPDTLILHHGIEAMREVLDRAKPLAEVLWEIETARPADTPERRAALEQRLEARVRAIADRTLQDHYRQYFRDRLYGGERRPRPPFATRPRPRGAAARRGFRGPPPSDPPPPENPRLLRQRQQEVLMAVLLLHPFLLNEVAEDVAELHLPAPDLDRLRHEILRLHMLNPDLDDATLRRHLTGNGFAEVVERVLSPRILKSHAGFARPEADGETVRTGWNQAWKQLHQPQVEAEAADAVRNFAENASEAAWARLQQTVLETKKEDDGTAGGEGS